MANFLFVYRGSGETEAKMTPERNAADDAEVGRSGSARRWPRAGW